MDKLQLRRYCCRRMVLTHVDLIEKLLHYNSTRISLPLLSSSCLFGCTDYDNSKDRINFQGWLTLRPYFEGAIRLQHCSTTSKVCFHLRIPACHNAMYFCEDNQRFVIHVVNITSLIASGPYFYTTYPLNQAMRQQIVYSVTNCLVQTCLKDISLIWGLHSCPTEGTGSVVDKPSL